MDFLLFLLVNATLFIRPAEIIPDLSTLPIYNVLILSNLVVALPKVMGRVSLQALKTEPITACVIGLLASIFLSHASHINFYNARSASVDFLKVVIYYILLIAVLDMPARLKQFLAALVIYIVILTVLAMLHYYGIVNIPSLEAGIGMDIDPATGELYKVERLCSTGIFQDPNDLSLILVVGAATCIFLAGASPGALPRPYWLAPIGLFVYALTLTYSRGGFLALLVGMLSLFYARFGLRKAALLVVPALPVMFVLFGARQTSISAGEESAQERLQIWVAGFTMLREAPLFGVGQGVYPERAGLVAHNSFIHAYGELGLLGGSLFLGAFAYAARTLLALGRRPELIVNPDLRRMRPVLLSMIAAYAFGMLTLSRNYIVPTYMLLGIVTAYLGLVARDSPGLAGPGRPIAWVGRRLLVRSALLTVAFLIAANAFIRMFVRWG